MAIALALHLNTKQEIIASLPEKYRNCITKTRNEISSSGYVVHSLEAALWSFSTTSSFEEGMILAVNLADDADTVGAIYGSLAGAFYGYDSIPQRWINSLHKLELLNEIFMKIPMVS